MAWDWNIPSDIGKDQSTAMQIDTPIPQIPDMKAGKKAAECNSIGVRDDYILRGVGEQQQARILYVREVGNGQAADNRQLRLYCNSGSS